MKDWYNRHQLLYQLPFYILKRLLLKLHHYLLYKAYYSMVLYKYFFLSKIVDLLHNALIED